MKNKTTITDDEIIIEVGNTKQKTTKDSIISHINGSSLSSNSTKLDLSGAVTSLSGMEQEGIKEVTQLDRIESKVDIILNSLEHKKLSDTFLEHEVKELKKVVQCNKASYIETRMNRRNV